MHADLMGYPSRSLEDSVVRVIGKLRPAQEDSGGTISATEFKDYTCDILTKNVAAFVLVLIISLISVEEF